MSIPSITSTNTEGVQNSIRNILSESTMVAQKISSGKAIIAAYEDPAGLAIGTQLEITHTLLGEALKTTNQAKSVMNIGYGGIDSVTQSLKRLSQLSAMALNGAATDIQRSLIGKESNQILQEINRIASATTFNGRVLLDGSQQSYQQIDASNGFQFNFSTDGTNTGNVLDNNGKTVLKFDDTPAAGSRLLKLNMTDTATSSISGLPDAKYITEAGTVPTTAAEALYLVDGVDIKSVDGSKTYFTIAGAVAAVTGVSNTDTAVAALFAFASAAGPPATDIITLKSGQNGLTADLAVFDFTKTGKDTVLKSGGMTFQVGADANQKVTISFQSISTTKLGISALDLSTIDKAEAGQLLVDAAVVAMLEIGSETGAFQARFNMIANNLAISLENIGAAKAEFLDADFTELTKQFAQLQAKLSASISAESKLIQTPGKLLQLLQAI
ncbi:MAG: flagellin [Candidatus Midichloriaceae bacterium]|jgi:flagellin